jgi:hypothetical protein
MGCEDLETRRKGEKERTMKRIFTVTWVYLESQRRLRVRADGGYVREGESLTFLDESLAWVCALRADLVTGLVEEVTRKSSDGFQPSILKESGAVSISRHSSCIAQLRRHCTYLPVAFQINGAAQ